jgi:hypothetical protein
MGTYIELLAGWLMAGVDTHTVLQQYSSSSITIAHTSLLEYLAKVAHL